jgi:hypothetical protein
VRLASEDTRVNEPLIARLRQGQLNLFENRQLVWTMVEAEAMPPTSGTATQEAFNDEDRPFFDHEDGTDVLGLDMAREQDQLRNWLACGVPVIERTQLPMDGYRLTVGSAILADPPSVLPMEMGCASPVPPEPNWPSIYTVVIEGQCVSCHNPDSSYFPRHRLDMSEMGLAYTNLVGAAAMGTECGGAGRTRVVASMPDASLLYAKIAGMPDCGAQMPLIGTQLSPEVVGVIRQWIADGAAATP